MGGACGWTSFAGSASRSDLIRRRRWRHRSPRTLTMSALQRRERFMSDGLEPAFAAGRQLIAGARRIAIVTHARPDGDAIGSIACLQHLLRQAGKPADAILFDPPGFRYSFMLQR